MHRVLSLAAVLYSLVPSLAQADFSYLCEVKGVGGTPGGLDVPLNWKTQIGFARKQGSLTVRHYLSSPTDSKLQRAKNEQSPGWKDHIEFASEHQSLERRFAILKSTWKQSLYTRFVNAEFYMKDTASDRFKMVMLFCERYSKASGALPKKFPKEAAYIEALPYLSDIRKVGCVHSADPNGDVGPGRPTDPSVIVVVKDDYGTNECLEGVLEAIPGLRPSDTLNEFGIFFLK